MGKIKCQFCGAAMRSDDLSPYRVAKRSAAGVATPAVMVCPHCGGASFDMMGPEMVGATWPGREANPCNAR